MSDFPFFMMIFKAVTTVTYASNRHYNVNTNHHWSLLLSDGENSNSLSQFILSHYASKVHCRHASSSKGELWSVIKYFQFKNSPTKNTPVDFYWHELKLGKVSIFCYVKFVEKWRAKMLDFTFLTIFKAVSVSYTHLTLPTTSRV